MSSANKIRDFNKKNQMRSGRFKQLKCLDDFFFSVRLSITYASPARSPIIDGASAPLDLRKRDEGNVFFAAVLSSNTEKQAEPCIRSMLRSVDRDVTHLGPAPFALCAGPDTKWAKHVMIRRFDLIITCSAEAASMARPCSV